MRFDAETEINQGHFEVSVDQNIVRLEVSMHDSLFVTIGYS